LARRRVARPAGEEWQWSVESSQHRLRRQHLAARRCQLDGQRQSVEPQAQFSYRGRTLVGHLKVGLDLAGTLDEERDGGELRQRPILRQVAEIGEDERWHGVFVLATQA
jgi:hypothetical protein